MPNSFLQYSTLTTGTISLQDTKQEDLLIHDNATIAATLTIVMPASPCNGQIVKISSRSGVTALTISSAITVVGSANTLAAGATIGWIYSSQANKWFRY